MTETQRAYIEQVRQKMTGELPGKSAQYIMASIRRIEELGYSYTPPPDVKRACVLNLLHFSGDTLHTVLIQRTINPHDRHSGQVSFPGGRVEPHDPSLEQVALREAEEEIGVPADAVEILGPLTELYIPVSNFLVYPFVGVLHREAAFLPQPGEVEAIFTPAIGDFIGETLRKRTNITLHSGAVISDVPYFDVAGKVVWGATAMILSEFAELLKK